MKTILSLALLLSSALNFSLSAQTPGFILIKKTVIGGEGGWDYLLADADAKRLYVSHSTQVEVLDLNSHAKIGTITGQGIHGIAVAPGTGRGVITNGRSNTATIFDLGTLKSIKELPTGKNPDALLYDKFSDRVFVFNHSGGTATAIDIPKATVIGTVELAGEGVEAGVSDGEGTIFVNLEDSHEIVSFDAKTLAVKSRWKISPGEEPTGLAIDKKTHRLFSACHNALLMVVDYDHGKIVAQVPIGKGVDGVVFDAELGFVITSNGEGSITIIKEFSSNEFGVIKTVKTEPGARTITLDPKTHHVFVSTALYGEKPAATTENPNPRPSIVPETFMVLELGRK